MRVLNKAFKGASFLSGSEAINQVCSLSRNIILARFLTKADFGVAALLGIILSVFELTNKMSLGQLVVQSEHGDNPDFVDGVQFTQFVVGLVSAGVILLASHPIARFIHSGNYSASIAALALIPFVNGLTNLDLYRRARQLGFGWLVLCDNIPQMICTLAAWPLAIYFRDYRAVLCVMLGKAALTSLLTQFVSKRRSRPRFSRHWTGLSLKFGWPLLLSGFVQFANLQGNSMVVAAQYTLSQLGEFDVATTIATVPGMACLRVAMAIGLPVLSAVQNDPVRLRRRYAGYVESLALCACLVTVGMILCGEQTVVLLFGRKYAHVGTLASWLIAAQALRLVRGATSTAAMARGDTVNNMNANLLRLFGLPLAIAVGYFHGSLNWFAASGFLAEIIAMWYAVARLHKRQSVPPRITILPILVAVGCVLAGILVKWVLPFGPHSLFNWAVLVALCAASVGIFSACFPALREILVHFAEQVQPRLSRLMPRWKTS